MDPRLRSLVIVAGIGVFVLILLWSSITVTINPGEKGVLFRRFGGGLDKEQVFNQGFHFIAPWNKMFVYNVKIQEDKSIMQVLSKNGLTIKAEISYRYNPVPSRIGYLHDEVGKNYLETIIIPEIRSATREVIGEYLPEELYSTKREAIQVEIFNRTYAKMEEKNLFLDAVLIREVELPTKLQQAIERKLEQEQAALEYEFKLDRAKKEAERLRIEAQGKSDANIILSRSLNENILRDKGIEATMKLAESPNSKVVVVGSGKDGLPLILGNN
ncbi:MAG: prohibitin family protein [Flavobacteriales bacterium]|nr:prohibitin family protein [Flavobacteriales bacterium]